MPQTPSAVGPSITPDWLLTQAVLKKCAWLTTFLSFYLGKSEVLWSGIRWEQELMNVGTSVPWHSRAVLGVAFENLRVWTGDSGSGLSAT